MNLDRVAETVAELRLFNHNRAADLIEALTYHLGATIAVADWHEHAKDRPGTPGLLAVITNANPPRDKAVRKAWRDTPTIIERDTQ